MRVDASFSIKRKRAKRYNVRTYARYRRLSSRSAPDSDPGAGISRTAMALDGEIPKSKIIEGIKSGMTSRECVRKSYRKGLSPAC